MAADMTSIKSVIFLATIYIAAARTISEDPGPNFFVPNLPSSPLDSNQRDVVMKEAILYLTPSQIKAYEASQGQSQDQRNQYTEEDILNVEAEIKRQLEKQNIYALDQNNNENPASSYTRPPPPVVEESNSDGPLEYLQQPLQQWKPIPKQEEENKFFVPPQEDHRDHHHQIPESYSYIKFYTNHETHETPKLQFFHPIPHEEKVDPELAKFLEVQKDPVNQKQYKLVPYEYKTLEVPKPEDLVEITKLTALLEKFNKEQNTALHQLDIPDISKDHEKKLELNQKEFSDVRYDSQYEHHKNTAEKFLINIEKENALAKAEAILKAPPSVIRKEIIKRRPLPYHGKERHHFVQRYHPDPKKEIPLEISVHKTDKSNSHRHVWKH